jgi:hypothetical protein
MAFFTQPRSFAIEMGLRRYVCFTPIATLETDIRVPAQPSGIPVHFSSFSGKFCKAAPVLVARVARKLICRWVEVVAQSVPDVEAALAVVFLRRHLSSNVFHAATTCPMMDWTGNFKKRSRSIPKYGCHESCCTKCSTERIGADFSEGSRVPAVEVQAARVVLLLVT